MEPDIVLLSLHKLVIKNTFFCVVGKLYLFSNNGIFVSDEIKLVTFQINLVLSCKLLCSQPMQDGLIDAFLVNLWLKKQVLITSSCESRCYLEFSYSCERMCSVAIDVHRVARFRYGVKDQITCLPIVISLFCFQLSICLYYSLIFFFFF